MIYFEVYITFVFVVVFASLVVISKIVIYDWWMKEKVLCMYTALQYFEARTYECQDQLNLAECLEFIITTIDPIAGKV